MLPRAGVELRYPIDAKGKRLGKVHPKLSPRKSFWADETSASQVRIKQCDNCVINKASSAAVFHKSVMTILNMLILNLGLIFGFILTIVKGQAISEDQIQCVDPNDKLTKCLERDSKNVECNKIDPNNQAALVACVCNQDMFSLIIGYVRHYILKSI
jgi:hypothetical protein